MEISHPSQVEGVRAVMRRRGIRGKAPVRQVMKLLLDLEAQDAERVEQLRELQFLVLRMYPVCMNRLQFSPKEHSLIASSRRAATGVTG